MEARDRATGDSNKQEREQGAFPEWTGTVNVLGHRRHFQLWVDDHNADRQPDDYADFQEGSQVVTWRQNQPYRQQGRDKGIANQHEGDGGVFEGQRRAPVRVVSNHAAEVNGGHQQHNTDYGDFTHAARTQESHVDPHEQRNRHGGADGEHAPWAFRQCFHHDQGQHRQDDDHNQEATEQGDGAWHAAHLFFDHLTQRRAVTAGRDKQHHKVLHRTRQHHARQQPQRTRQIAHLRSQHRADQRASACDGGKVVTKQHVAVGWHVVQAVIVNDRRGGTRRVELHDLLRDIETVVAVRHQIDRHRGHDDPQGTDVLAAAQGNHGKTTGTEDPEQQPGNVLK